MSGIHSGPLLQPRDDLCGWRHHYCGVWLSCDSTTLPGGDLCADHYIDLARVLADSEAATRLIPRKGKPAA